MKKLNLGCGDKILEGYINVDVAPSRKDREPDVLCDLRKLSPFEDNTADEILSVHVIEHFWRWEVDEILREWKRVLKPGGKIVIECPNLLSACKKFLEDPEEYSKPGKEGQQTMWVFYGDPSWQDPLMIHRWGYTPKSLSDLLISNGFTNVRQEPAQYKLREPRDMRICATKPINKDETDSHNGSIDNHGEFLPLEIGKHHKRPNFLERIKNKIIRKTHK